MPPKFWIRNRVYHKPSKKYGTITIIGPEDNVFGVDLDMGMGEKYLLYPVSGDHLVKADDAPAS